MTMKFRMIPPNTRDTLEYAEAIRLLCDRRVVKEHLDRIDKEIKLVKRISPSAVEQARKDIADHNKNENFESVAIFAKEH